MYCSIFSPSFWEQGNGKDENIISKRNRLFNRFIKKLINLFYRQISTQTINIICYNKKGDVYEYRFTNIT